MFTQNAGYINITSIQSIIYTISLQRFYNNSAEI